MWLYSNGHSIEILGCDFEEKVRLKNGREGGTGIQWWA
jgi:hypothetical protein